MRHIYRLKKSAVKSVFNNKMNIKSVSIETGDDVENAINNILIYSQLESTLDPVDCSYNFINSLVVFQLELKPEKDKMAFFEALKIFEDFMGLEA